MGPTGLSSTRSKRRRPGEELGKRADGKKGADGLYHCDYCHRDLTSSLRIKCAVCPDFDLCLECFSVGAEVSPHASDHAYRVVDNLTFPVFAPDWGADEELLLLEAVEQFGLGGWARAAEHVGRAADECRAHYFAVYVDTEAAPLPRPTPAMGAVDVRALIEERRATGRERVVGAPKVTPPRRGRPPGSLNKPKVSAVAAEAQAEAEAEAEAEAQVKEEAVDEEHDGAAAEGGAEPPQQQEQQQQEQEQNQQQQQQPAAKKQRRGGAEGEAKPHATPAPPPAAAAAPAAATPPEAGGGGGGSARARQRASSAAAAAAGAATPAPLPTTGGKSMHATPLLSGDGSALLAQTEAQQTGYHLKRNEFDPEYDQEAEEVVAELEFNDDEPPEEAAQKLRLIQIYNRRLDERQRRKDFVLARGLLNVKRQAALDRRRGPTERELVGRLRVLAPALSQPQWEALAEGLAAEARLRGRIAELQRYRSLGMRTFEQVDRFETVEAKKRRDPAPSLQAGKSRLHRIPVDECALESELAALGLPHAAAAAHAQHTAAPEGRGTEGLLAWRRGRGVLLDVVALPDLPPLCAQERALCAQQRYLPAQYLAVKAEAARLQAARGWVSRADVQALPFLVHPERAARLHAFFVDMGWVRAAPPPAGGAAPPGGRR